MPNNIGVIPEFFYPDGIQPILTKEFLENVPDNSCIIIYKGLLRKDCYIVVRDGNSTRIRAMSKQYTFNECISELATADMALAPIKRVASFAPIKRKIKVNPKVSNKEVDDMLRRMWSKTKDKFNVESEKKED